MRARALPLLALLAASCTPAGTPASAPRVASAADAAPSGVVADLVVLGGVVWTGVAGQPDQEAVAIAGDRVLAVGSHAEIRRLAGPATRVIDAAGGLVVPGFIDSHVHFITGGFRLTSVQLRDADTPEEFITRIRDFARTVPPGTWILGGDWDHTLWGGQLPTREWVDSVTPEHPVWVNRLDGHMALANSATLRMAGVTRTTPEVAGGEIVRDARGDPEGVLKDNAMDLVWRVVPEAPPEISDRALEAAMRHVAGHGVTSVHNMGSWQDLAVFRRAHERGRLRTRILAAVPVDDWERLRDTVAVRGHGDEWLRIGGLKGFVDGSLGSHTAAFHEPFTDMPGSRGLLVNEPDDLYRWIAGADAAGLQPMIHAIGDRANRIILDVFERVIAENGPRDRRFRIEHAQHIAPVDIPRFGELGVIASMQPYHAIDDGRWADRVIGPERSRTTYAFRDLLDTGARLAFGSDWYVAPPTPLEGIFAAVTRRTLDGANPDGWVPEQRIAVEEALRAYTSDAAYASFEEDLKGSLAPGMLADLVVLERDLRAIPPEEIRDARVVATVVGGHVVAGHATGGDPLRGRTILLDPGHGGTAATDTFRVGPTGEREEWVNLRVALLLRGMLEERGARVVITRTGDVHVPLPDRGELAREVGADVFVSVHHNGTADPDANFPIVYFHGEASANPASVRLGRLVAGRLNQALFQGRAETVVVSDHVIFPAAGTTVLRHSYGIPGVIGEASFFTNPAEEARLRDPEHNRREAEAYALALQDFFAVPIPPVLPRDAADPLPPFEAVREGERLGDVARGWRHDFAEGRRLLEAGEPDLDRAFELLTRSVRGFPDSPVAGDAHRLRAGILDAWGRDREAEETRRRVREFYP
jgi:predicted amidohydrolase YtcJ